jgi:hypothetical protein
MDQPKQISSLVPKLDVDDLNFSLTEAYMAVWKVQEVENVDYLDQTMMLYCKCLMDPLVDQIDDSKLAFPIAIHLLSYSNSTDDFLSLTKTSSILVAPILDVIHLRILVVVVAELFVVVVVVFDRQAVAFDCLWRRLAALVHLMEQLMFVSVVADVLDVHNFEFVPIDPKQFEQLLFSRQYGSFHCFSVDILGAIKNFHLTPSIFFFTLKSRNFELIDTS